MKIIDEYFALTNLQYLVETFLEDAKTNHPDNLLEDHLPILEMAIKEVKESRKPSDKEPGGIFGFKGVRPDGTEVDL